MKRAAYRIVGLAALGLGFAGIFLPLLPTVPFMILAAFCFAKGSPAWEARLLADARFGPHIRAWRERGAISRKGKVAAALAFVASSVIGFLFLDAPLSFIPAIAAVAGGSFVLSRPAA